jgi:capsid protein
VDPQKELDAAKESVRCGFTSVTQVISERGYDVEDTFADIAREQALADKLGLVLDTDARQTANNGQRPNRNNANPDGIVDDPGQPGSSVIQ